MPHTVNLASACRRAAEADSPEEAERVIHTALVAGGVPTRLVASLRDPLDFDGPAAYLAHIREALAPGYDIKYPDAPT